MTLKLVIGNKNYSSWSMRPWLALRGAGIAFEEIVIPLYTDDPADKARILAHSPAGKVPVLVDGATTVWDSLAIIEYAAERFPQAGLWPADAAARAHARSVCAEMHSGFQALRNECPMNLHRPVRPVELSADAKANVARIEEIWRDCRARHGAGGPFLFGRFGAADAMFAPVVTRFHSFAVPVAAETRAYMDTMMAMPAFAEWVQAGLAETWIIARVENV
ncbi:glutathione S-transferase family protein [Bradyrhizobium sp. HKCCYLS3077]|uniref:glutathione S-transferase family protein n=1 Tax=Bradyrhizobium sp. HKCCYLS3077 TaxID=3420761 RepID=UPI003EBFE67C